MTSKNEVKWVLCFWVICAWLGVVDPKAARAQLVGPLPVEDALKVHYFAEFSPVGFSPDGKWLAYAIRNNQQTKDSTPEEYARTGVPSMLHGAALYLLNVQTSETRDLTDNKGTNWLPTWSPDGHYLAFLSDRDGGGQAKLWIWDAVRNDLRKVSDIPVRAQVVEWTPDSQKMILTALPEGVSPDEYAKKVSGAGPEESKERKSSDATVIIYQSAAVSKDIRKDTKSDPWSLDTYWLDLVSVDVDSGKVNRIVRGHRIAKFLLSSDGSQVAYTVPKRFERAGSQQILFDFHVTHLDTNQDRTLASDVRLDYDGAAFSWSPDGQQLAYHTGGMDEKTFDCFTVDAQKGSPRNVTMLPPAMPSHFKSSIPLWDPTGHIYFIRNGALWWASVNQGGASEIARIPHHQLTYSLISQSGDLLWTTAGGRSTIVVAQDEMGKQDGFYKIGLMKGESTKLLEKGQCYSCALVEQPFAVSRDGRELAYFAEDAAHESEIWMSNADFQNLRQLTHLNPQFEKYKLGSARLIDWLSDDGERLRGALLLPSDYEEGKRYPLIVWVYGGSLLSNHFDRFGFVFTGAFNMQLLATRGYAVLLPDAPQHVGTPMLDLAKTVLAGVNKVIEMGIADPDRLGVMGQSYGGYSTLSLIVQTKRFKAALEADGMGDLLADYGAMDKNGTAFGTSIAEGGQGLMNGTPWEFRERYIENSPIYYLDRVDTPLLIVHGSEDTTVAPFLGDEVFVGLRRLGKEVEYAKYQGEGHSQAYWSYANQVDFCNRMIAWFDKYLKPRTAGLTTSAGGSTP